MRILVTGHRGHVGAPVARHLEASGHEVVGFDRADGQDLLDAGQVRTFARGCDAIVHLAGLPHDTAGTPEEITTINVRGTSHVLAAAVVPVIHFSSAQVLGTSEGEGLPDYFPINDSHSRRAARPYGLSKCRAEDLCAAFTARTGVPTVSLRPTWVWSPRQYAIMADLWRDQPSSEWEPFWEFGAFVDERDVATAVELALTVPLTGHHRLLLCADDIAATAPSLEMTGRLTPGVPVHDPEHYRADPWCSLVDCSEAARVLGWRPRYRWANRGRIQRKRLLNRQARGYERVSLPALASRSIHDDLAGFQVDDYWRSPGLIFVPEHELGGALLRRVLLARLEGRLQLIEADR